MDITPACMASRMPFGAMSRMPFGAMSRMPFGATTIVRPSLPCWGTSPNKMSPTMPANSPVCHREYHAMVSTSYRCITISTHTPLERDTRRWQFEKCDALMRTLRRHMIMINNPKRRGWGCRMVFRAGSGAMSASGGGLLARGRGGSKLLQPRRRPCGGGGAAMMS